MKKRKKTRSIPEWDFNAATSSPCWGKSPYKRYKGVAGKGGKTTNFGGGVSA